MTTVPTATPPGWAWLAAEGWTAADAFVGRAAELAGVRAAARRDLGLARILDGHRNGVERLLRHRPQDVPAGLREEVARGTVPVGVWGADPRPGEGDPARLVARADGPATVEGVKTFCSGAGVARLALVLVRPAPEARPDVLALVDVTDPATAEVDRSWFASPALRSSESHRVVFRGAPVVALLGAPGALLAEPWFSGDALRTAATWAGALDAVVTAVRRSFADRVPSDAEALLAGRMAAAHATVDRWLDHACAAVDAAHARTGNRDRAVLDQGADRDQGAVRDQHADGDQHADRDQHAVRDRDAVRDQDADQRQHAVRDRNADPARTALTADATRAVLMARLEIAERAREVLRLARELTGSWPVATDDPGARAARDLDLLLVQHRLTPAAARLGRATLGAA